MTIRAYKTKFDYEESFDLQSDSELVKELDALMDGGFYDQLDCYGCGYVEVPVDYLAIVVEKYPCPDKLKRDVKYAKENGMLTLTFCLF